MSSHFALLDWAFVLGFLVFSAVIGILAMRRVSSIADFLVAGRKLNSILGIATLASTEMGLVTIIYFACFDSGFVEM